VGGGPLTGLRELAVAEGVKSGLLNLEKEAELLGKLIPLSITTASDKTLFQAHDSPSPTQFETQTKHMFQNPCMRPK